MQIYAALKIEVNRNLSCLFTLRFSDFDLVKANTSFTEDNFMYKVRGCLFTGLFYFNILHSFPWVTTRFHGVLVVEWAQT